MSYIKRTLLIDEKLYYYSKPHPIIFFSSLIWLPVALFFFNFQPAESLIPLNLFGMVALIICGVHLLGSYIKFQCSEFGITNRRVLMKVGFIQRQSFEIFLNRIEGVRVDQSVFGRIFNYGTVTITGMGGGQDHFYYIPKPLEFRSKVQQQLEKIATH